MSVIPIRDVPDDVLAATDAQAHRVGLSRADYLRRALAARSTREVSLVTTRVGR